MPARFARLVNLATKAIIQIVTLHRTVKIVPRDGMALSPNPPIHNVPGNVRPVIIAQVPN